MFQFELHTYTILVGHRNIQKELYLWIQDAKCLYCWSKALFSITGNRLIQLLWEFTNGGLRYYRGPRIFNPRTIFPQPNGATYNLSVPTGVLGCGCCAADVVSSPGGWTQCLAAHCHQHWLRWVRYWLVRTDAYCSGEATLSSKPVSSSKIIPTIVVWSNLMWLSYIYLQFDTRLS